VTNLALSGLTTRAADSPLRTCVVHCPPGFALRGCPAIFPIHSQAIKLLLSYRVKYIPEFIGGFLANGSSLVHCFL
jgi:hypothetical protein